MNRKKMTHIQCFEFWLSFVMKMNVDRGWLWVLDRTTKWISLKCGITCEQKPIEDHAGKQWNQIKWNGTREGQRGRERERLNRSNQKVFQSVLICYYERLLSPPTLVSQHLTYVGTDVTKKKSSRTEYSSFVVRWPSCKKCGHNSNFGFPFFYSIRPFFSFWEVEKL